MLDTKSKNRHKLAVLLIILTIAVPTCMTTIGWYDHAYAEMKSSAKNYEEESRREIQTSDSFVENFVETAYILYNTEYSDTRTAAQAGQIESWLNGEYDGYYYEMEDTNTFRYLLDYRVEDGAGSEAEQAAGSEADTGLASQDMSGYSIGIEISFDENGVAAGSVEKSSYAQEQGQILARYLSGGFENTALGELLEAQEDSRAQQITFETPKNRTYLFAMSEENLDSYLSGQEEEMGVYPYSEVPDWAAGSLFLCMLAVCAAAFVLPLFRTLRTGDEKIFMAPLELPVITAACVIAMAAEYFRVRISDSGGTPLAADFLLWAAAYALIYWSAACLRHVVTLGPREYFMHHSLTVPFAKWLGKCGKKAVRAGREGLDKLYRSFDDMNFGEKNNKTILKIILINFAVLFVITCLWFVGIPALIVYSVILYFVLRKYFNDLKEKYKKILCATGEMAKGNLEVEIDGDLGVFHFFADELEKIQEGYQKAVEKEVRSQRMKTELVTNVSHDLKTPLTAIITYVNLLKEETDEEKRQEYIDVLERKSLRLRGLIEDLFEISKVSSQNMTLNLSEVEVVSLFKQVQLEVREKCDEAGLDFRCDFPKEKLVAELDGQKTYRIFENLLVNVTKYAMENTRVYVKIERQGDEAAVRIMNISASELTVNPEELTERFVRGDASRNTDGSGLGLAIAKSFTEVQKGRFLVETEGDLFKVTVFFPLKGKEQEADPGKMAKS